MSFTSTVPASVPSVFHNSVPVAGVKAAKNSVSPTTAAVVICFVNCPPSSRKELPVPGTMSASSVVPGAVPSVRNHSVPVSLAVARK